MEDHLELFRSLIANAPYLVTLVDREGTVRFASPAAHRMLGRSPDEMAGTSLADIVHPADARLLEGFLGVRSSSGTEVVRQQVRVRHGDGSWRTLEAVRRPAEDGDSEAVVCFDDVIDGTPSGPDEPPEDGPADASEARYRQLFERNLAGVFRSTIGGEILDCNEAFARILGCDSAAAMIGRNAQTFYPSESAHEHLLHDLRRTGELINHEMVLVRLDGTPAWVLANIGLVPDGDGELRVIEGTMINITEKKRADDRLLLHAKALESASSAILITDSRGVIQWVNPAFTWLTGYPAEEAIGAPTSILKSGRQPDTLYEQLWRTITDGRTWRGELVNRRRDGTLYHQDMTITPVRSADGDIEYFIAVMQDITERRDIEDKLRQAQRMEAVGRLAGGVAHDFNNLLQAMLGLTQLLQQHDAPSDRTAARLQELEGHIQRASQVTRQLLLFSHPESAKRELVDFTAVVRESAALLERLVPENIVLEFEPGRDPLAIEADRGQLEQIVMNLAVNAADAMPDGGQLSIRTGAGAGNAVWLEVEDTGTGIPDNIREHLFEPFFTTKERSRGTGLGLSVVHGIVTLHGGDIDITSEQGRGTTFRITLPGADAARLLAVATDGPRAITTGSGERILLVEDDPAVRHGLHEILVALGYHVTTAAGRLEVEDLIDGPGFDLLLSDFGLPDATGMEIAALLQLRWPELKVIIMSGYAESDVIARHVLSGDLHFLQKPFTVLTLSRAVQSVLSQGGTGDPAAGDGAPPMEPP